MAEREESPGSGLVDVRALFPGAAHHIYLDVASVGLLPQPVRTAVERYLDARALGAAAKPALKAVVESTRTRFARLVGGEPDEVAVTKNVSEGLNLFASSLPWQPGDNVVVCPAVEHPNNVYLWYNLKRLRGIEVRAVRAGDGRVPVEAMAEAMDGRTRVVTVPHVSFSPGFVTDVAAIARAARAHGAALLVDAAQSTGAVRVNVGALGADALVTAAQKSLHSVYGYGFLWIRRELADQLVPAAVARYGIDTDVEHSETALMEGDWIRYKSGARRFDIGNYNYLGAAATDAALALIETIGVAAIEAHVRELAARLAAGLLEIGLPVAGGAPGPHLAHIVTVAGNADRRHDTEPDPRWDGLYRSLASHGVRFSIRRANLRFSVGVYNRVDDIERVLVLAREWAKTGFRR